MVSNTIGRKVVRVRFPLRAREVGRPSAMSSYDESDGDKGALVEPEGVNAGGPVDEGASPADPPPISGEDHEEPRPEGEGQGQGELLSGPGSDNGLTRPGPGQELSAQEG